MDELKSVAGEFQSKIQEIILADPAFVKQFSGSPTPPANHISGGTGTTAESTNIPSNRKRTFDVEYHYYWPDNTGHYAKETEVLIKIRANYDEQSNEQPVINLEIGDSNITRSVVEMMEAELSRFDFEIVKTVTP